MYIRKAKIEGSGRDKLRNESLNVMYTNIDVLKSKPLGVKQTVHEKKKRLYKANKH